MVKEINQEQKRKRDSLFLSQHFYTFFLIFYKMKNKIQLLILFLICMISLSVVNGQISTDITSIKCGDKVLDEYNMCEKDVDNRTKCDKMGELLKIDTGCWEQTCACAPKINSAFCGNDRREGAEMCDGTGEDFCEAYGEAIGWKLKCIPDQCICELVEGLPSGYDPEQEEEKEDEGMAVCGDMKLHSSEECDPPNTLCELDDGSVGVCAQGCVCIKKESIGFQDETDVIEENKTQEIQQEETKDSEIIEIEETTQESETLSSEEGFFSNLWNWFKSIF